MRGRVKRRAARSGPSELVNAHGVGAKVSRWLLTSPIAWVVAVADLAGAIAGYTYWYGSTILASPWYYWVFVPDCPLAATFMGIALLAYRFGRTWRLVGLLAAGMSVKYGLWTVVSWTIELSGGGPLGWEGITMAGTHSILLVQGLLLCCVLSYRWVPVLVASLYIVGNDLVDYTAGQYPALPASVDVGPMMWVAVSTTAIIVLFWAYRTWMSAPTLGCRDGGV